MKCKVDDLCFIKKAIRPVNIGRVVTCKQLLGYFIRGEEYEWNGELYTAIETDYLWVIESKSGIETQYGKSAQATSPDSWLTPIKADGLGDETTESDELVDELTSNA